MFVFCALPSPSLVHSKWTVIYKKHLFTYNLHTHTSLNPDGGIRGDSSSPQYFNIQMQMSADVTETNIINCTTTHHTSDI